MTGLIEALHSDVRNLLLIGVLPHTNPDYWPSAKSALFRRTSPSDVRCSVIAESDTQLFQHSLRSDTKYSKPRVTFTELRFRRDLIQRELDTPERRAHNPFRISTLPLPIYVAQVDDEVWYLPVTGESDRLEHYRKLSPGDPWFQLVSRYIERLLDPAEDGRYVAGPNDELLELFDQQHIPRGIYPRDCFYDTDHYQYVVWDFVFSRRGELLIHKRKANAKDNQDMWDKSVGGHIDFNAERSSHDAAVRELIEELYTKEQAQQTGHAFSLLSGDKSHVYYLGEWRPGMTGPGYLDHAVLLERDTPPGHEPWVYYKVPGALELNSPRLLPTGSERKLRVLADVFVFIANTLLTPESVRKELLNSEYLLIAPARLKTWTEARRNDRDERFITTPDMEFIMSGSLRDLLDEVSQIVKYSELRK